MSSDAGAGGLSTRAKAIVGALIGVLYAIGMSLRGDVLPGVVGGILAGHPVLPRAARGRAPARGTSTLDHSSSVR